MSSRPILSGLAKTAPSQTLTRSKLKSQLIWAWAHQPHLSLRLKELTLSDTWLASSLSLLILWYVVWARSQLVTPSQETTNPFTWQVTRLQIPGTFNWQVQPWPRWRNVVKAYLWSWGLMMMGKEQLHSTWISLPLTRQTCQRSSWLLAWVLLKTMLTYLLELLLFLATALSQSKLSLNFGSTSVAYSKELVKCFCFMIQNLTKLLTTNLILYLMKELLR